MRRLFFAFAATAALLAGACSLTTDLGGYAGDLEAKDGATNVPATDGGPTAEAAADASTVPPAPRFCEKASTSPSTLWCRDFDDGRPLAADVEVANDGTKATSVVDDAESVSAPASLRTRIEQGAPSCTYARVIKVVQNVPKKVRIGFDVKIGGPGTLPSKGATFFFIGFGSGSVPCSIIFSGDSTTTQTFQQLAGSGETFFPLATPPFTDRWARVDLDLDQSDANAPSFSVTVDGAPARAKTALAATCVASVLTLQTGILCEATPDAPREVRYDNLVVTALP